jgi:hypothetical protein
MRPELWAGRLWDVKGRCPLLGHLAEFAFDGDVRAFGEAAGEIGEFPENHAPMPLGARLSGSGIVLPGPEPEGCANSPATLTSRPAAP